MADHGVKYPPIGRSTIASRFVDQNTLARPSYNWDAYGTTHHPPIPPRGFSSGGGALPEWGQLHPR